MLRALLLLTVAAALALPAAAQASLKVTWPEQRTYAPGEIMKLRVVSSERVRVAFVRVTANGKVMRTLWRRTLSAGTRTAIAWKPGHYELRVAARTRSVTVAAAPVQSPSAPLPIDPGTFPTCTGQGDSAELRLSATTIRAGETLPFDLVNTSTGCETAGVGYSFERRLADGSFETIPLNLLFPALAVFLPAGTTYAKSAPIPADFAPGGYRLLDSVSGASGQIRVAVEFDSDPVAGQRPDGTMLHGARGRAPRGARHRDEWTTEHSRIAGKPTRRRSARPGH